MTLDHFCLTINFFFPIGMNPPSTCNVYTIPIFVIDKTVVAIFGPFVTGPEGLSTTLSNTAIVCHLKVFVGFWTLSVDVAVIA
jgi:hypothetical protein